MVRDGDATEESQGLQEEEEKAQAAQQYETNLKTDDDHNMMKNTLQ